jgi:hypothetical protein
MQALAISDAYYVDDQRGNQRSNGDEELGESHVNCNSDAFKERGCCCRYSRGCAKKTRSAVIGGLVKGVILATKDVA